MGVPSLTQYEYNRLVSALGILYQRIAPALPDIIGMSIEAIAQENHLDTFEAIQFAETQIEDVRAHRHGNEETGVSLPDASAFLSNFKTAPTDNEQ